MQGVAMEDVVAAVVMALAALVLVAGAGADDAGDLVVLPPPSPATTTTTTTTTTTAANTTTSTTAAAALALPTLACSTSPARDLTVCQLTDCGERMPALFPCLSYLQTNTALPNAECCAALQQLSVASLICFCDVTFYPPVGLNISLPLQYAMPSYCNINTDVCSVCPASLTTPVSLQVTCSKAYGPAPAPARAPKKPISLLPIVAGAIIALLLGILAVFIWRSCLHKKKSLRFPDSTQELDEILKIEGKPTVYSYSVLKTATRNFHQGSKLGEGGFGAVYKGVLPDGTEVAVKQLSVSSRQGKEEFLNEVMLITGVQHRNLVKLRGCCLKGDERLLVYEFLENRSLHQALFDETCLLKLDWPTRLKILLGTARGLAYLHEGCSTRIIHRDIKASNILLDRDLNPKIADFGLARLFQDNQSHVSTRVAGTVGYLAPEYAMRGQLTEKADVFSFGIVALELVSGRGNLDLRLPPEMAYLLDWTWHLHEQKNLISLVDPTLVREGYSDEEAMRVVEVALLCTQSVGTMRPMMTRVVELLTGGAEIEIPEVAGSAKPRSFTLNSLGAGTLAWKEKSSKDIKTGSSPKSDEQGSQRDSSATATYVSAIEPR